MKTQASENLVQRVNVGAETAFTIKATASAFQILSSGLYSDKIKAVVRELATNAHDSHVAAGKADTQIEVKLPNYLDHTFYVKDFGIGLSHEGVTQLYTTYFESTKTNSDDFIGQLGLGSKSPFSYAATFTVESRFEGVKRVYTCFKNEQGMPAISMMGMENTNETNGLTVSLAVKREDIDKFNEAARKVFMYFDPRPVIKGDADWAPYKIKHTIAGTNWKIRETDYYARMERAYVVQGFVAYPVDTNILAERGLSPAAKRLANTNLDLYVEIGKVEVAASREALSYDVRTIQNLINVLEDAAKEMRTSFQKEFDACNTTWEVAQLMGKFADGGSHEFREIFTSLHMTKAFTWNGAPVERKVDLDLANINNTTIRTMSLGSRKITATGVWTPENTTKTMTYDVGNQNLHVLVDTEAKGHSQLAEFYLNSIKSANGRNPVVLIISPTSKKLYSQAEVDTIVRQLGNPATVKTADLGYTRTKVGGYKKRSVEEKMVWAGFPERKTRFGGTETSEKFSRLCWRTESIDLEDGGFYVDVERFTAVKNSVKVSHLDDLIEVATELGFIGDDFTLYGMNERDHKHIAGNADWIEFTDFVAKQFAARNVNETLYKRCIHHTVLQQLGSSVNKLFVSNWKTYFPQIKSGKFVDFFDNLATLDGESVTVDVSVVRTAIHLLGLKSNIDAVAGNMFKEWRAIIQQYGMLGMIDWDCVDTSNVNQIINYINAIESSKP